MKTKNLKVCDAIHVDVFCELNDYSDIKCGGPTTLGYDFYVSPDEDEKELKNFIELTMKKYNRHYERISFYVKKDFPVKKLWSKKDIEKCIKECEIC